MTRLSTGFHELDPVLHGGIAKPSCTCVSGEATQYITPFVFQIAYTFLQGGLRGLYVCLDKPAEEIIAHFKEHGFNIDRFTEDYSLFFLDFFSQSQEALIESAQLGALLYNPDDSFLTIGQFMDWIKNGFLIIDTLSTFILNLDTKKAYEFIRALKLLARTFNLVIIGVTYLAPLEPKTAELLRSVSDGHFAFENYVLHVRSFFCSFGGSERLLVSKNERGCLVLKRLYPSGLNEEIIGELEAALTKTRVLKVNPTLTLATAPTIDLPIEKVMPTLEKLSSSDGILDAKPYCTSISCPRCDSQEIYLYLKCLDCGNILLEKGETLEHFNCGHIGFRPNFEREGKLVCPKCHKELRQIGVDYKQIGAWYKCSAGHISPNIQFQFVCSKCSFEFDLDSAKLRIQKNMNLPKKENNL